MASKRQITNRMEALGMAWATRSDKYVSPDDPMGDQTRGYKTYHVHPDRSEPWATAIKRFGTLGELEEYITLREKYAQAIEDGDEDYADALREDLAEF